MKMMLMCIPQVSITATTTTTNNDNCYDDDINTHSTTTTTTINTTELINKNAFKQIDPEVSMVPLRRLRAFNVWCGCLAPHGGLLESG